MHVAALSVLIALLLVVRNSAVTAPTSECAYFGYYYYPSNPLLPSLVPSISSICLAAHNSADPTATCIADCQLSYSVFSQCNSVADAEDYAASTCGLFKSTSCSTLAQNDPGLEGAVRSQCSNGTYCSPNCSAAIAALEQYSGCCSADDLNGPKVLCGQQTIAPCSTILNTGSVAAPTSECAYVMYYGAKQAALTSRLPSVNAECTKRLAVLTDTDQGQICIAECQSFFALFGRCGDSVQSSNYQTSMACGMFNNQNCSELQFNTVGTNLITELQTACSNSTYCPPSCVNAIAAAEGYGGCCYASYFNGPKVLCSQQPIAPCSTIVSSGGSSTFAR
eukprot:Em0006g203a